MTDTAFICVFTKDCAKSSYGEVLRQPQERTWLPSQGQPPRGYTSEKPRSYLNKDKNCKQDVPSSPSSSN